MIHEFRDSLSRIARDRVTFAVVVTVVLVHGPLDIGSTWMARSIESNPIVLALGWNLWLVLKATTLAGFLLAYWFARDHWLARPVSVGCLLIGLVGPVGNAHAYGWMATSNGVVTMAGIVAVAGVFVLIVSNQYSIRWFDYFEVNS